MTTSFADLNADCIEKIALNLKNAKDIHSLSCVSKNFRFVQKLESVWEPTLQNELGLDSPFIPVQEKGKFQKSESFKTAYYSWVKFFQSIGFLYEDIHLAKRFVSSFFILCKWANHNLPNLLSTLSTGITEAQWTQVCKQLKVDPKSKGLRSLKALYRLCNGQDRGQTHFFGLFGGFSVYDLVTSTYFLKTNQIVSATSSARTGLGLPAERIIFAISADAEVFFSINPNDGMIYYHTSSRAKSFPAVPINETTKSDYLISWFEHYTSCLNSNSFKVSNIIPDHPESLGICLFPQAGEGFFQSKTKGICVSASTYFIPSQPGWAYSVQIKIIPKGEDGYLSELARGYETAQLRSRHWIIVDFSGQRRDVTGLAVVGKFPLLREGGFRDDCQNAHGHVQIGPERDGTFVYQSCTGPFTAGGTFSGSFTFAYPDIQNQVGTFEVEVPTIRMNLPTYFH